MYAAHFGLKQAPFSIAPDPRYLYMSERHREALAHLLYGVGGGGGFVLLTGDIGAGKTTVCRCFLEQIPRRCNVAYVFNPRLNAEELLQTICEEFRIPVQGAAPGGTPKASLKAHVDALNEFLLKTHSVGQNNVLIIDEAQNLAIDVLEQLRLLTNLETNERKLLQIILIGQPELRQMLARPDLEQLAQRVIARFHLGALTEQETALYIQHRLATAGLRRGSLFDGAAVKRVHQLARGVPRRINLLCDRALLGAYAEGRQQVDKRIVERAATEVFDDAAQPPRGEAPEAPTPARPREATVPMPLDAQDTVPATEDTTPTWMAPVRKRWPTWAWAGVGGGLALSLLGLGLRAWQPSQPAGHTPLASASAPSALGPRQAPHPASAPGPGALASSATAAGHLTTTAAGTRKGAGPAGGRQGPLTLAELLALASPDEDQAWRQLALAWGTPLPEGAPCEQARRKQLACFSASGGLALLRQLDRPAWLMVREGRGPWRHAVMSRLDDDTAWFETAQGPRPLPLRDLALVWRGDFATLWRTPEGYRAKVLPGQQGPVVSWIAQQLARVDQGPPPGDSPRLDDTWLPRLQAFQVAQGLKPDGVAGATTLMLLNRASGVSEPRLSVGTAVR